MELRLNGLSARHPSAPAGAAALKSASISVAAGEAIAIIGPSGAGKTTLLHAMACALKPAAGELQVGGVDPWAIARADLKDLRSRLILAPQVPPLPPRQRVVTAVLAGLLPQMGLWASLASLFYPRDIRVAHEALVRFDLSEKLFERVDRLSGGERQRVGLARVFAAQASLWLVDEPLSALDPTRSEQALSALVAVARERKATLICSLHQVERALSGFPRIIGLRSGEVVFDLPTAQVTPEILKVLYAQHEDELFGITPLNEFPAQNPSSAAPAVMHCR